MVEADPAQGWSPHGNCARESVERRTHMLVGIKSGEVSKRNY